MRHRARGKIRREIRFLSHGCKAAPPRQRRRLFVLLFSALTAVRQASNAPHSRGCECGQQRLAGVFQTTFAKCPTVRTPFFALMAEKYPPALHISRGRGCRQQRLGGVSPGNFCRMSCRPHALFHSYGCKALPALHISRGHGCGWQRLADVFQTTSARCHVVRASFFALTDAKYPPA